MSKTIRLAIIDQNKCRPKKCAHECKKKCVVERQGKECINIEDTMATILDQACIGCGMCVRVCPFKAIQIVNLPTQLSNKLLFSYGQNSFKLYNFPIPRVGKIYGFIGCNGMGKSTLMGVLSGRIPIETTFQKGTELQTYFDRLPNMKIKIKRQTLPHSTSEQSVKERIMTIFDADNSLQVEIIESLDLESLYPLQVSTLSGGEKQRLMCAMTLMSGASGTEVIIFDEPSNFLDISQRMKVGQLIRNLSQRPDIYNL